jgi:hypothetical protein
MKTQSIVDKLNFIATHRYGVRSQPFGKWVTFNNITSTWDIKELSEIKNTDSSAKIINEGTGLSSAIVSCVMNIQQSINYMGMVR